MRTSKRFSLTLNQRKWNELVLLARTYRAEKNIHLRYYNVDRNFITNKSHLDQQMRNVRAGYANPNGLQARQWKIVQKDAYETVEKNWCALGAAVRELLGKQRAKWSDDALHYAYWLVQSSKRMAQLVDGDAPVPAHFKISYLERKRVRNYLRRVIRRKRGQRPQARLARSTVLDADMYRLVETDGRQYLRVMGRAPRKQMVIPLTGYSQFSGNIRLVLDFEHQRVVVHVRAEVEGRPVPEQGETVGLDAGTTEVFMDELGTAYEPTFGATLKEKSQQILRTGQARNKAHALRKTSSKYKARRIRKYNLGRKKLEARYRKGRVRVQQQTSRAIRLVAQKRSPNTIVTERLDIRGKAKSKHMSRVVTNWQRKILKEKLEFLALVEGFHHKQVNPAFSSQMCPTCLFVYADNRKGDRFQCLYCGYREHADRVAAINLRARASDPDITIYTPKSVVKDILDRRFIASLQKQGKAPPALRSVSGRTGEHLLGSPERNAEPK